MVPVIANRGHSFKGAGLYYLHDKKADTNDRVAWTHIHNIPTENPDKAFNWMAYTAMNANNLKRQAGIKATGRKATKGAVYSFSLAWHPEQTPDKQTMLDAALETLGLLELQEHEAVFVAHRDTSHPHVHVVCNLVHPENGITKVTSYDRLTMSQWAEKLEGFEGEIRCEQRVLNNEARRKNRDYDKMFGMVKHREDKLKMSTQIQELYNRSDNGTSFRAALSGQGFTIAKGDKRGFVLVDEQGNVSSLSRQLKGQRATDINKRLEGIGDIPLVKDVVFDKTHFDRDKYEAERQIKIVDAAIEEDLKKEQEHKNPTPEPKLREEQKSTKGKTPLERNDEFLNKLDAQRSKEEQEDRLKHHLKEQQDKQYNRADTLEQIKALQDEIAKKHPKWSRAVNQLKNKQEQLDLLKQNLENMDSRIQEQNDTLDKKIEDKQEDHPLTEEELKQKRAADIRRKMKPRGRSNNHDSEPDTGR